MSPEAAAGRRLGGPPNCGSLLGSVVEAILIVLDRWGDLKQGVANSSLVNYGLTELLARVLWTLCSSSAAMTMAIS